MFHENYTFETRYLGTRGIHLPVQAQLDRIPAVNGANALPFYTAAPSQATLNGLTSTLAKLTAIPSLDPVYAAAGFASTITSYQPWGNSTYHGWANQLTRRFSNGLQFMAAYTFSHNIDDSTAEVFSTYTTPRRPQNIRNLRADRASSALDHRHRLTYQVLYDVPVLQELQELGDEEPGRQLGNRADLHLSDGYLVHRAERHRFQPQRRFRRRPRLPSTPAATRSSAAAPRL